MNVKEYQLLSRRTLADLGTQGQNAIHMQAGIFTEFGELIDAYKKAHAYGKELDVVNVEEELADIIFYAAGGATFAGNQLQDFDPLHSHIYQNIIQAETWGQYNPQNAIIALLAIYSILMDKEGGVEPIIELLFTFADWAGVDLRRALQNNVNKLKVRYPDRFTEANAITRNLEQERSVLEA